MNRQQRPPPANKKQKTNPQLIPLINRTPLLTQPSPPTLINGILSSANNITNGGIGQYNNGLAPRQNPNNNSRSLCARNGLLGAAPSQPLPPQLFQNNDFTFAPLFQAPASIAAQFNSQHFHPSQYPSNTLMSCIPASYIQGSNLDHFAFIQQQQQQQHQQPLLPNYSLQPQPTPVIFHNDLLRLQANYPNLRPPENVQFNTNLPFPRRYPATPQATPQLSPQPKPSLTPETKPKVVKKPIQAPEKKATKPPPAPKPIKTQLPSTEFTLTAEVPLAEVSRPINSNVTINTDPIFENHHNTIILENDDDIELVNMDIDDELSDDAESAYDPNDLSLLDLDYKLTKDREQARSPEDAQILITINNDKEHDRDMELLAADETEYWRKTRDCDYRIIASTSAQNDGRIDRNLKMHRRLSRKKSKKLKAKMLIPDISGNSRSNSPFNRTNVDTEQLNLDHVDDLPYEDLISVYNKLKEELTLLNCNEDDIKIVTSSELGPKPDEDPTGKDNVDIIDMEIDEIPEGDESDDCQLVAIIDRRNNIHHNLTQIDKEEEDKLNLVLQKDTVILCDNELSAIKNDVDDSITVIEPPEVEGALPPPETIIPIEIPLEPVIDSVTPIVTIPTVVVPEAATTIPNSATINKYETDAFNENLLREQLIRTLLEKRLSKLAETAEVESEPMSESLSNEEEPTKVSIEPKASSRAIPSSIGVEQQSSPKPKEQQQRMSTPTNITTKQQPQPQPEPIKPKVDLSYIRLVIQLSGSEESHSETDPEMDQTVKNRQTVLSKRGRFVNGRLQTNRRPSVHSDGYIHKLSKSQQEEYLKLKKEIERRELKTVSNESLQKCEMKLKESILASKQHTQQMGLVKRDMLNTRKQLRKSKNQVRQLEKMLLSAKKKVSLFTVKLQLGEKKMTEVQSALKQDEQITAAHKQTCLNIGQKLQGPSYTLPVITTELSSPPTNKLRQRIKSFNEIKEHLNKGTANKEMEIALRYLRGKVRLLLKPNYTYETILMFDDYVHFSFGLFKSTTFFQTSQFSIEFNEFSEKSDILQCNLDAYPQVKVTPHDLTKPDNYQSVLQHFKTYRFASHKQFDNITADHWSNALNPNKCICMYELFGVCHDANCQFQHQKDYIYDSQEKIIDVLSYLPQLDESLNLEEYKNDPKALRAALKSYVQEKLDTTTRTSIEGVCQDIASEIKAQSRTSVSSFLIRSIPKELITFSDNVSHTNQQVHYDDYYYRFDLTDEFFKLNLAKICNLQAANDPDFHMKNRFFAPEGVPLSAQLETSLASDPHNILMWINLAYCYLKHYRTGESDINFCIDSALNVLSRALEQNKSNAELYEQYLIFYSNKMQLLTIKANIIGNNDREESPQEVVPIKEICTRILKYCSTYRLWICYLNLSHKLLDKVQIVTDMMENFCSGQIQVTNEEERSLNIIEIILYRVNLFLQLNRFEEAVKFFNSIFLETSHSTTTPTKTKLSSLITKQHRVFAWLCYMHLILYRCLPYHCFHLCKKSSFLYLANTRPFVFNWKSITSEGDLHLVEKILQRAIRNCCISQEDFTGESSAFNCHQSDCRNSCFPLRFNLAQLTKLIQQNDTDAGRESKMANSYSYLSTVYSDNFEALSHLHILQLFDINLHNNDESVVLSLIENFYNSYKQETILTSSEMSEELWTALKHQVQFNYWLAYYHAKYRNVNKCKQILVKCLAYYFCDNLVDCDAAGLLARDDFVLQLFELILFDDFTFGADEDTLSFDQQEKLKSGLKFGGEKRAYRLVYIYLSYLMYLHLSLQENATPADRHYLKLDCAFSSVINSYTSSNLTNSDEYKYLWLNYFLILLEFPYSDAHFKSVYETLRLICVNFNASDPIFVYHLTSAFSELVVPRDRLFFLIELAKLCPDNANLIIKALNLALLQSKKETCWNFITTIVYEKRIRLQCFEFWKIATSLSIERCDHLNTHKFFQMALTLMPFNAELWEMLKQYETSVNHAEHTKQLQQFQRLTLPSSSSS